MLCAQLSFSILQVEWCLAFAIGYVFMMIVPGHCRFHTNFRFSNGTIIRRARFGIKATLYEKWFAELDVDFANNEVEIKDMFMG